MLAADFDKSIEAKAKQYYRDYNQTVKVRAETKRMSQSGRAMNTSINEKIEQSIILAADYSTDRRKRAQIVKDQKKNDELFDILDDAMPGKVLVFIEEKRDVENLFRVLEKENKWTVGLLHSNRTV